MTEMEQTHVLDECDEDYSNADAAFLRALRALSDSFDELCAILDEKE